VGTDPVPFTTEGRRRPRTRRRQERGGRRSAGPSSYLVDLFEFAEKKRKNRISEGSKRGGRRGILKRSIFYQTRRGKGGTIPLIKALFPSSFVGEGGGNRALLVRRGGKGEGSLFEHDVDREGGKKTSGVDFGHLLCSKG